MTDMDGQTMPATGAGYENRLLALLCLVFGMVFWDRLAINYMLPFITADLRLNNTQAGLLVSILALSWAVSGIVVSAIADRTGQRKWLLVGLTVAFSLASLLSGMATAFVSLLVMRFAMGLAQGPVLPIAQATMARESTPARRGLNMGLLQNLGNGLLANMIAPLVIVAVAAQWGWRTGFMLSGLPGLVLAALLAVTMRRDPPPARAPSVGASGKGVPLRDRNVLLCLAAACLLVMWLMVQMTFLPAFMLGTLHFSSSEMAIQLSIRGASGLVAGIALPALSDRFGRRRVVILGAVAAAIAPAWVALPGQTFATMALGGMLMGAGLGCLPLVMAIIPSESVPPDAAAATMGLIMGLGELVGGFIAPVSAGAVADWLGPQAPFVMAAVAAVIAAALATGLRETGGPHLAAQPLAI